MDANINIGSNSYGFTKGHGKLTLLKDNIEIEGLKSKNSSLRVALTLLYISCSLIIFFATWFLVTSHFFKLWGDMFTQDPDIASRLIYTIKRGLAFVLFIVFPLVGAFWLANKLVNPIRRRFAIPAKETIPYKALSAANIATNDKFVLNAFDGNNKTEKLFSLKFEDISLQNFGDVVA